MPANTFVATAEAVCAVGARPRFVDVLPDTLLIDPAAVEAAVTPRTAAIMAVHLFGQMADVDALGRARGPARPRADRGRGPGARGPLRRPPRRQLRRGGARSASTRARTSARSATAAPWCPTTRELASRIRRLADHGRSRHRPLRPRGLGAATAGWTRSRRRCCGSSWPGLDRMNRPRVAAGRALPARPAAVVRCRSRRSRGGAGPPPRRRAGARPGRRRRRALDAAGIGWGLHYPVPCHQQPAFAEFADGPLPVAEAAASGSCRCRCRPTMTARQVDRVCEVLAMSS